MTGGKQAAAARVSAFEHAQQGLARAGAKVPGLPTSNRRAFTAALRRSGIGNALSAMSQASIPESAQLDQAAAKEPACRGGG